MPRSYASTVAAADPEAVWSFLRNFDATPDYVELITASEILDGRAADQVGCERKLTLADGNLVLERLVALTDVDRSLTYHLYEGPFPFWNYYSTIRVTPVSADGASFVEWWAVYDCESADAKAMEDLLAVSLFGGGLAAVRERFAAG